MAEPVSTRSQSFPGHETTDVSPRAILVSALVLGVALLLVHAVLWWAMRFFNSRADRVDPQVSPLAGHEEPPAPRLRASPAGDLDEFLAAERKQLGEYRWIDRQRGVVRIPIERAMDLLVERGLPDTTETPAPEQPEIPDPTP